VEGCNRSGTRAGNASPPRAGAPFGPCNSMKMDPWAGSSMSHRREIANRGPSFLLQRVPSRSPLAPARMVIAPPDRRIDPPSGSLAAGRGWPEGLWDLPWALKESVDSWPMAIIILETFGGQPKPVTALGRDRWVVSSR